MIASTCKGDCMSTSIESIISFLVEMHQHNQQILAIEDQGDACFVVWGQPNATGYSVGLVTSDGLSEIHYWTDGLDRRDPNDWHINDKKAYASRHLKSYLSENYFAASMEAI